jgi:hypothetical protein
MSVAPLPAYGFFRCPHDEQDPDYEAMYRTHLEREEGPLQYYWGEVGMGKLENGSPILSFSVDFFFTWNTETREAEVKAGSQMWDENPAEKAAVPNNVVGGMNDMGHILCFAYRRYDYTVSISRVMNAILGDHVRVIRIGSFTDEERALHKAGEYKRYQHLYTLQWNSVYWPTKLEGPVAQLAWLKKTDGSKYATLEYLRRQAEFHRLHMESAAFYSEGAYLAARDGVLFGPCDTETNLVAALAATEPLYYPAEPYRVQKIAGAWQELPHTH